MKLLHNDILFFKQIQRFNSQKTNNTDMRRLIPLGITLAVLSLNSNTLFPLIQTDISREKWFLHIFK